MHYLDVKKQLEDHEKKQALIPQQTISASASSTGTTRYSTSGRFYDGSKWAGGLVGQAKILDQYKLRQNSRNAQLDSVQAQGITKRMVDNEIGTGLVLESTPVASMLGITEQDAERKGDEISQRFDMWAQSMQSTLSETQNFYQFQWQAGLYQQRDNDFLTQIGYSARRDLISPVQVKLIDPDQLVGYGFTSTDGIQNNTGDGIERDANGKEIAYWLTVKENGFFKQKRIPAVGARSGKRIMCHSFRPEFAEQGRGFSLDAHHLQNFRNLEDFALSHILKAIAQSQLTMFVKPSPDADASDPYEGLTADRAGSSTVTASSSSGNGIATVDFTALPEATMDVPGSVGMFNLTAGEDMKVGDQNAPIDSYKEFVDSYTSYLAASRGMPVEVLLMRFNNNYSASRATLLLHWNLLRMWRANLVAQSLHPIYTAWLGEEIASGRVNLPGWSDPRLRAAWVAGRWNGTPLPNIDPVVTAKANKLNVELGATNLDAVARDTNGSDGAANRAKLTRQLKDLPIPYWADKPDTGGGANGQP